LVAFNLLPHHVLRRNAGRLILDRTGFLGRFSWRSSCSSCWPVRRPGL